MRRAYTREEAEASLLSELAATFRPGATKDHIISLENALRPMCSTLPKEEDGTLRHEVVRYVLHRFFVQRGWFIRGLEPSDRSQDSSAVLQEWVPSFLQGFLEELAGGRGISLRELAVLAATLEDLVHKETLGRLEQAYEALQLPLSGQVSEKQSREVLEVFMMIYMLGGSFSASGQEEVRREHEAFTQEVKDWSEVQDWVHGIKEKFYPGATTFDFSALSRIVEEIGFDKV